LLLCGDSDIPDDFHGHHLLSRDENGKRATARTATAR